MLYLGLPRVLAQLFKRASTEITGTVPGAVVAVVHCFCHEWSHLLIIVAIKPLGNRFGRAVDRQLGPIVGFHRFFLFFFLFKWLWSIYCR
jgi:amino acid permease